MAQTLAGCSCRTLTNFVNDLEVHQRTSETFFSPDLLRLLAKHFGCANLGITAYRDGRYIGACGIHKAALLTDYHKSHYHKRDVLSKFITNNQELIREPPIIRITDLIEASEYRNSEYSEFLGRAGLKYIAVMVFQNYRICLYREPEEGDFDPSEVQFTAGLHEIIAQKNETHKLHRSTRVSSQCKGKFLEREQIGYLVFDSSGRTAEYNSTAERYVQELFNERSVAESFADILSLLSQAQSAQDGPVSTVYKGYTLTMSTLTDVDCFGVVTTSFCITIVKSGDSGLTNDLRGRKVRGLFGTLSARELEVLDAFCDGLEYQEIAKSLFISENTVRSHLKSIYRKLDVANQRALVRLYCQYSMAERSPR